MTRIIQLFSLIALSALVNQRTSDAAPINFNRDIRPILSDRCFHCHGPSEDNREADLRLDLPDGEQGALTDRDGSIAIKPGDLESSALWHRITTEDEGEVMPPPDSTKKALTPKQQQLFKQWILEGAKYDDFWAFIPPKKSKKPKVDNQAWNSGLIDPYIMARLEEEGIKMAGGGRVVQQLPAVRHNF